MNSTDPSSRPKDGTPQREHVIVRCIHLFGLIAIAGTVVSLLASYNWIADLLGQLRVQYVVLLASALLLYIRNKRMQMAVVCCAALAFNLTFVVPYFIPHETQNEVVSESSGNNQQTLRLLIFNVLRTNPDRSETLNEVLRADADIVFLMEVAPEWITQLEKSDREYPFQKRILREDYTGVALLSKHEWRDLKIVDTGHANPPLVVSFPQLEGQSSGFRIILTHPLPPISPYLTQSRDQQLITLAESVRQDEPTLLAGDFNLTPWSPRFQRLLAVGQLSDSATGYGITPTLRPLPTFFGGLKVDHVLRNSRILIRSHEVTASDHSDHSMVVVDFTTTQ